MNVLPNRSEMLNAFLEGDQAYDGVFFTGVRTTGIFCKPSCRAKKPLAQNVEFFPNAKAALFAGYRPCLRCKPLHQDAAPEWVQKLMAAVEASPDKKWADSELELLGIEPTRVRRFFVEHYGMTFHAYTRARRLAAAFTQIRNGADLDDVVFDSGYESHSGFRTAFGQTFGKAPGQARQDECIRTAWVETPFGSMISGATSRGLCLLEFTDRRMFERQMEILKRRFRCSIVPGADPHLDQVRSELKEYFEGRRREFTVTLDMRGTEFQERVWSRLLRIPYGQTWSYEDLAKAIGNPAAVRAVAGANGMNRIAVIIPCHRVVNKNGELGGYGGGLWRKTTLLELEKNTVAQSQQNDYNLPETVKT